jgi:Ca2+-binding EF-hand superfamily protein
MSYLSAILEPEEYSEDPMAGNEQPTDEELKKSAAEVREFMDELSEKTAPRDGKDRPATAEELLQESLKKSQNNSTQLRNESKQLIEDINKNLEFTEREKAAGKMLSGMDGRNGGDPDGYISKKEFETVMPAKGDIAEFVKTLDFNNDGKVDTAEFAKAEAASGLKGIDTVGIRNSIRQAAEQPGKEAEATRFAVGGQVPAEITNERARAAGKMLSDMDGFMGAEERDGFVTEKEFKAMMPAKGDVEALRNTLDLDKDGKVETKELETALKASGLSGLDKMGLDAAVKGLGSMLMKSGVGLNVGDTSVTPQSSKLNAPQQESPAQGAER